MTRERPQLWQAALDYLRGHPIASEPWGRDQGRVEELLAELYLLGERPTVSFREEAERLERRLLGALK